MLWNSGSFVVAVSFLIGYKMAMTVVYKALGGEDLKVVMKVLGKAGLNPVVLDNANPTVVYKFYGTYKIRVGVKAEEANLARKVIAKWQREAEPVVKEQSQLFFKQVGLSCLIGILISIIFFLFGKELDGGVAMVFFFSTMGAMILISNIKVSGKDKDRR